MHSRVYQLLHSKVSIMPAPRADASMLVDVQAFVASLFDAFSLAYFVDPLHIF